MMMMMMMMMWMGKEVNEIDMDERKETTMNEIKE